MSLREKVCIKTPSAEFQGELFVGKDGLPELEVLGGGYHEKGVYTPATLPNEWTVCYGGSDATTTVLLTAWQCICDLRQEIMDAQREAEKETPNAGE